VYDDGLETDAFEDLRVQFIQARKAGFDVRARSVDDYYTASPLGPWANKKPASKAGFLSRCAGTVTQFRFCPT
jgi:hypothetical protein